MVDESLTLSVEIAMLVAFLVLLHAIVVDVAGAASLPRDGTPPTAARTPRSPEGRIRRPPELDGV